MELNATFLSEFKSVLWSTICWNGQMDHYCVGNECLCVHVYMCEAERLPVSKHAALNEMSSSAMSALEPEVQKACTLRWKLCSKQMTKYFRRRANGRVRFANANVDIKLQQNY